MANINRVEIGESKRVSIGGGAPLAFICGPCVIESREHALMMAGRIAEIAGAAGVPVIFKASYDKANRTSGAGYRGIGLEAGLEILNEVRERTHLPVVSDVHEDHEARAAAKVLDLLQIPAFLCRQTSLLQTAGSTGKPVMLKKGQFLHPSDMAFAVEKVTAGGANRVLLCERGACFGYRDLVVDLRSLAIMRELGCPVVFDATHSVQVMGGAGGRSTGNRRYIPLLARAAVAAGIDAIFLECHDNPAQAPSDGPNMVPLDDLALVISKLTALDHAVRELGEWSLSES